MPSLAYTGLAVLDHRLEDVADYVIVSGEGRIEGLGRSRPPSWARTVEVDGYIHPPFVDAHLHVSWLGLALEGVDLRGSKSPGEVARRLSRAKGPIAYGRGWDQEEFDDPNNLPDRRLLDQAVPDRPAVAVRVCGHVAAANTVALDLARPWEKYPGYVDRARGLLYEDAVYYTVERLLEEVDVASLVAKALHQLETAGIAGVSSMACPRSEADAIARLGHRVLVACYPKPEDLEYFLSSHKDLTVGVKLFSDGTLGARTAYLREPYSDDPGNRGTLLLSSRQIEEEGRRALGLGLRIAVHAIGDAALDEVLDAYERLDPGPAGRIEHASIAWDGQARRIAGLGVWTVVQPRFRVSDWWIGKRLGPRARLAYRFRTLRTLGARMAVSSDAPVEPYNPRETIDAAVGRCPLELCRPEESLSPREVFEMYTRLAAEASGGPVSGLASLEPGSRGVLAWSRTVPGSRGWSGVEAILWPAEG